jgi:transcriptional regulator with XRE-family HTH domain
MNELGRQYGRLIHIGRRRQGLTQVQLAARLGVTQTAIDKWERGVRIPRDFWRGRIAFELDRDTVEIFPPPGRLAPIDGAS